jgi:transcriptional regulator with XRE-family HTH domain
MAKITNPFSGNMSVKDVLFRNKINQTELCRKLGFSREAFSKVVNGHRDLSVHKAKAIAELYDLDWRDFYETPSDRYKQIDGIVTNLIVEKAKENIFIVAPKEWHNNSLFHMISYKYGQWNEYVYVFEKRTHEFNPQLLNEGFALYTFKDGLQVVGEFNGYDDPNGQSICIYNAETHTWHKYKTNKVKHIQMAKALLTPNKK